MRFPEPFHETVPGPHALGSPGLVPETKWSQIHSTFPDLLLFVSLKQLGSATSQSHDGRKDDVVRGNTFAFSLCVAECFEH